VSVGHVGTSGVLTEDGTPDRYVRKASLSDRLTAVARMIQIGAARSGPDGFSPDLIADAEALLAKAGERLRLSSQHTIVVLAGGTGSGKSSLFNVLAGADFSPVGVLRPVTREPHACVWGMEGAGPLLDWLEIKPHVRFARSSALDEGERALTGLLLVDLPDHDSVVTGGSAVVSRLVGQADLMVWVLDPQKYADAAVHSRYLVPMAGHSAVMATALNQVDLLVPEQVDDCVADLRRLLDAEGLHDARVVVTSAVTGEGIPDLRNLLVETVIARQAALQRIGADVDALAARFAPCGGEADAREPAATDDGAPRPVLSASSTEALADAFSQAAGVSGVCRTLQSARELKAVDHVGWPVARLADRVLRRDPARKARLGTLWEELREVSAGTTGAQQAEIKNAITVVADEAGRGLPTPWQASVRSAARSRTQGIPAALGASMAQSLPAENKVALWWRAVAAWQGLLLGAAVACLAWLVALIVFGVFHASANVAPLLRELWLLPWVLLLAAAILLLGWLTANGSMTLVERETAREAEHVEQDMHAGIAAVAQQNVLAPVEQEFSELSRFRDELATARGTA
jgi:energy-coupling factor transporter ATP-binding protein EcfA2